MVVSPSMPAAGGVEQVAAMQHGGLRGGRGRIGGEGGRDEGEQRA